jgi:Rieske Fe-S protein
METKPYRRARLVDASGRPLSVAQPVGSAGLIFHYPYVSTPAMLLDLGRAVPGGIVAFSAICTHQFAYPTAALSAINYRPGDGRINCCLHGSVFDPAQGGAVLAGPAPQPLTAIALDIEGDELVAHGTRGPEVYEAFFRTFKRELREQYGRGLAEQFVEGDARAVAAGEYSRQQVLC